MIPIVSVKLLTYNHEQYIKRAIESILSQKIDFEIEIIIGNDCSSDRTGDIIREYKDKYPDIIKIVEPKYNIGGTKLTCKMLSLARGKYIAELEGDDYWCDCYKLQKQVDFLEAHSEYIGCSHRVKVVNEYDEPIEGKNDYKNDSFWNYSGKIYTINDFEKGKAPGHLSSLLYRNIYVGANAKTSKRFLNCHKYIFDRTLNLFLALSGNIYRLDDVMSCYMMIEKVGQGNWQSKSRTVNTRGEEYIYICKLERLARIINKNVSFYEIKKDKLICATVVMLNNFTKENRHVVKSMLGESRYNIRYIRIVILTIVQKIFYRYVLKEDKGVVIKG